MARRRVRRPDVMPLPNFAPGRVRASSHELEPLETPVALPVKQAPRVTSHLVAAYLWLALWSVLLVVRQVVHGPAWTWLPVDIGMIGFGFSMHLVLGVGRNVLANLHSPRHVNGAVSFEVVLVSTLAATVSAAGLTPIAASVARIAGLPLGVHVVLSAAWAARRPHTASPGCGVMPSDWWAAMLARAAIGYACLAGWLSLWLGILHPATLHAWLVGVVVAAIFAVSHRWLPRFRTRPVPSAVHGLQAVSFVVGTGLLVVGFWGAWGWATTTGGAMVLLSVGMHAGLWIHCMAHRRNAHPIHEVMVLAGLTLCAGLGLGIGFTVSPTLMRLIPVHAVINLMGFVGLTAFGAKTIMIGASGLEQGRRIRLLAFAWSAAVLGWSIASALPSAWGPPVAVLLAALTGTHAAAGLQALRGGMWRVRRTGPVAG